MNHADFVQPLNYSAHAIEQMRLDLAGLKQTAPQSAAVFLHLVALLQDCTKFLLPNTCDLLDPTHFGQAHLDLLKLPYPRVALEAPWQKDVEVTRLGEFDQMLSTKRIAVCWALNPAFEPVPGINAIAQRYPEGGIFVVPISWIDVQQRWNVSVGGAFVPYANEIVHAQYADQPRATQLATDAMFSAGLASGKSAQFSAEPFVVLPELFEQSIQIRGSRDKAFANLILDCRDEVSMLLQTCSVLNCENVETSDVLPPKFLNQKRAAKGKQPFFSYKVLQLAAGAVKARSSTPQGGHHDSPRMHLRRGHLRRLEKKTVWVRPSIVGSATQGTVAKDYNVQATPRTKGTPG